ncbi:MAG: PilN domain-containing protein [Bacteriovoracaceae bacterium]
MIKINLSSSKKQLDISNVGGFDFTRLKIKAVLLVSVLIYLPDFVLLPMWTSSEEEKAQELSDKQKVAGGLRRQVAEGKNYENQIKELKAQEEALEKKLVAVKEAISFKKNPSALLLYIAKNTPPDMWIKDLVIENDSLLIKGEALDYTSIGNFVQSLRASVFIRDANVVSQSQYVREPDKTRIEVFDVRFGIARFDQ